MPYYFDLSEKIKTAFVDVLKRAFKSNLDYTYVDNLDYTRITILESWTTDYVKYPAISVECGSIDLYRRTIGEQKKEVTFDVSINGTTYHQARGLRIGGTFNPTVTVAIVAESSIQRDQIADWVGMYLRHIYTGELAKHGIALSGISKGGGREVVIGNDPVFFTEITCETLVDWEEQVLMDPIQTISGICQVTVIETLIDGSTYVSQ